MRRLFSLFAAGRQPDILKTADRFKRRLLAANDKELKAMARAYSATWKRIKPELDAVNKLVTDAVRAGTEINPYWLAKQKRLQKLLSQCEAEITRFSKQAISGVKRGQRYAIDLGLQSSAAQVKAALGASAWFEFHRVPKSALVDLVGFMSDGSPLEYKFKNLPAETAERVKDTISSGFAQGWNPRRIAREVKRKYNGALSNALVTCRTETMRAYRHATHETYRANDDVLDGWIWTASKSGRTCAGCLGMDGTLHPLDEELSDHPSGRCVAVPHVKPDEDEDKADRLGGWEPDDYFKQLSESEQARALGETRHRLWKDGKVKLRDLSIKQTSHVWGDHYRPKTLKELLSEGLISRDDIR